MIGDERCQRTDVLLVQSEDVRPLRDDGRRLSLPPEHPRRGNSAPRHGGDQRLVDRGVDIVPDVAAITALCREPKQGTAASGQVEPGSDPRVRLAWAAIGT